ncbi:carboxypeptidase-like regulatory domain-containing protein [Formosa sp. A9]|uniref:carboxypeptidase-like regulatory domain-containing protein n=1 Tax=Formosa sp. A9 TaxID=3442641 RepID=UPI003EB8B4B5
MKKTILASLFLCYYSYNLFGQQSGIFGSVKDALNMEALPDVEVVIEGAPLTTKTNALGEFGFTEALPLGQQILKVSKLGYITKRYPIIVEQNSPVNIQDIFMEVDPSFNSELFTIVLSDDELNDDTSSADNISGLLRASQDVFQRTAAFEFGSSFFKIRGLDAKHGDVLINGVKMNGMHNGRPQWSNWGGINDVLRNQEFNYGLSASNYSFGNVLGVTNTSTQASMYRQGGRITYSASNRTYSNRLLASYASGMSAKGWAYAVALGRRWGNEGYQDATIYDANSFFLSVEKQLTTRHSLNFTGFYTPNKRGKSSPNTQEVFDLKDIKYNEYWGYQEGEKRNSRIKYVAEPIVMLSHYWAMSSKTKLQTNLSYKFGKLTNSRLDYPGGANPSPSYYQKLPSYFLADTNGPDYGNAYLAEQEFIADGQIDWNRIYDANITNTEAGLEAAYVLYDDRTDDQQFTANTIYSSQIEDNILLQGALNYTHLTSHNYGQLSDLLGGIYYLNVDAFDGWQYNMLNPDEQVGNGGKIKYNYKLYANNLSAFAQIQLKQKVIDYFLSIHASITNYQREGLFMHEAFQNNSLGKSNQVEFSGLGAKGGFTYKWSAKHIIELHAGWLASAPELQNTFSNPRENNAIVNNISEEKITALDVSYIFRSTIVNSKLTAFYINKKDANDIGFYYADGLTSAGVAFNETSAFVQEILQAVNTLHYGLEFGVEAQVTTAIKLKAAGSVGQYIYNNNPNLYLTSSSFITENGAINFGDSQLKNYRLANGPQQALSLGFEYRDPDYWWFGATVNYFNDVYVDVSPLTRTSNFYLDDDGLPFNDYDETVATQLLKQERFNDYYTVNLVGGKSWKLKQYYLGIFLSVNNLLNAEYKTGGFEQGRNANYEELKTDFENPKRVFGPKYWYGRGTTYFANVNVRF